MNIRLATGTPNPTQGELERFRNYFLEPRGAPAGRFTGAYVTDLTIGKVLDSRGGGDCTRGRWSYKASTGKFSARYAPCRSRSCPKCVRPFLEERVAPAWAFWKGKANRHEHAADLHLNWHRKTGFKVQGPNATVGGLVVPQEETVVVFWPGDEIRGSQLDGALLKAIRAVPIVLQEPGDPVPWMGSIPPWMSRQEFVELVRSAGGEDFRLHGRGVGATHLSRDEKDALVDALWDRSRGRGDTTNVTQPETGYQGRLSHFTNTENVTQEETGTSRVKDE